MTQLYLPNEPPNESCKYYLPRRCNKHMYCPMDCGRFIFLEDFYKDEEDE